MQSRKLVPLLLLLGLTAGVSTGRAQQNCGELCERCGIFQYQGHTTTSLDRYDKNCNGGTVCTGCQFSVSDHTPEVEYIVRNVQSLPAADLRLFVRKYAHRLLLNRSRSLLVVQGNRCDPQSIESVVFLSPDKASALDVLGVRSLEEALATGRYGASSPPAAATPRLP